MERELRCAIAGAGFWARYQIAGWRTVSGVRPIAIYNRTVEKAEHLAGELGIPAVYSDPEEMLERERPDFLDVITAVEGHAPLVHLAARRGIPVVCQKPMATTLAEAEGMVAACRDAGVPFFVHENWRWQTPIRALKQALDSGAIGRPFRARLAFVTGFPAYTNQPFLKTLERFIITDMGSHLLDVARFYFGEADSLYCQTGRVHHDIRGEDVATIMLRVGGGVTVVCDMALAENYLEHDAFPQTPIFVEGERGSIELAPGFSLRVTTKEGTLVRRVPPPHYPWADPAYDVVHASIVDCNRNLLSALRGEAPAETTAEDNLKTMRLVFAAYDSAEGHCAVSVGS